MTALRGVRIIELAESVSGEYCGKLLADFGAELIKVERPGSGSPTRSMAPIMGGDGRVERSGLFAYLNTNKKSVALDLASQKDAERLHKMIAAADVVIDDHDEGWLKGAGLSPEEAARDHPSVIFCSITPFGHGAPRDWWNAKSLNIFHRSGWGYHTPTAPDPARPPLKGPGRFLVDYDSALDGALCIVSSLFWRRHSQEGQFIDVSQLEVMVSRCDTIFGRMLAGEVEASPARTAYDQGGPHGFFPCYDGAVYLYMTSRAHWAGLRALMGEPEWAAYFDEDWLEFGATESKVSECRTRFAAWVRPLNKDDVSAKAQKLGVPLVPVNDARDVQRSQQFVFREFFQRLKHPVLGEALYPTVPYKLSASPARITHPAPLLGQHNEAESEWRMKPAARPAPISRARKQDGASTSRGGPLEGVRVLELTKVWAGPHAGKLLAFLGAEVIKVESRSNLDEMRAYGGTDIDHAPYFLSLNPEILSVQVNLKSEDGLKQLRGMIAKSDIVLNNIRPGAMERSGLGYEDLRAIKRDIISVSIKMFGNDGPLGYQTGYAPCFAALGGLNYLVGYEGEPPSGINMRYGDSTVGVAAAFAALVALMHRERTGEGQFVDVSAVETMASMVGDSLFAYSLTGRNPAPDGNAHADMAPHGCYPCRGGAWLSLAVTSDAEWRALCMGLGQPDLADDPRYRSLVERQTHRSHLDEQLSALTKGQDANDLAERLRARGVAAFKSQSSLDLIKDEYLWRREFFRFVSDEREGQRPILGAPWRMSTASASISRGAPRLGEHNDYVYKEVLGLSDEKLQALIREGVVA
jgi:crotonobetainyl-CoA:carnitine CoA-transferase CaiB-like acyl-CoA transferase